MKNKLILLCAVCLSNLVQSQEEKDQINLKVTGFVDVFYAYDFNRPSTNYRQPFLFNHNRHNEVNLNLGYIKFAAENNRYRANLALQAGTYANDNYASEQGLLKNVYEGNAGIALDKQSKLWLDAGIFSSHLGFESPQSNENLTLTRSLMAESSPYFLCGAKLTYSPSDKWEFAALAVNGWQRINRQNGNTAPGLGSQIQYKIKDKLTVNWSTYIGSEFPDIKRRMRYFSDFWIKYKMSDRISLITGLDYGMEEAAKQSELYFKWYAPIVIAQYKMNEKWAISGRYEYYNDANNVIVPTVFYNGFKTHGYSLNFDYSPAKNVKLRLEGRGLSSAGFVFVSSPIVYRDNYTVVSSIAISF